MSKNDRCTMFFRYVAERDIANTQAMIAVSGVKNVTTRARKNTRMTREAVQVVLE